MPRILIARAATEIAEARRLRSDLRKRDYFVQEIELGLPTPTAPSGGDAAIIIRVPKLVESEEHRDRIWRQVRELVPARPRTVLLVPGHEEIPPDFSKIGECTLLRTGGGIPYDDVLQGVLVALLGPLPSWLDLIAKPSAIELPTGVGWWSDALVVADEHFGHVVRITSSDVSNIDRGLAEPHHIHVDRTLILIANKGADEVRLVRMDAGIGRPLQIIHRLAGQSLRNPQGLNASHGLTVVADTDNHRVLITKGTPSRKARCIWEELRPDRPWRYPIGIHIDGNCVWVADTFNHRVVVLNHAGDVRGAFGTYGFDAGRFSFPVGIVTWRNLIFVADENATRLQCFVRPHVLRTSTPDSRDFEAPDVAMSDVAGEFISKPFGLAVNRSDQLAVTDRGIRAIWVINLKEFAAEMDSRALQNAP